MGMGIWSVRARYVVRRLVSCCIVVVVGSGPEALGCWSLLLELETRMYEATAFLHMYLIVGRGLFKVLCLMPGSTSALWRFCI